MVIARNGTDRSKLKQTRNQKLDMKNNGYSLRGPKDVNGVPSYPAMLPRNANRSKYGTKITSKGKVVHDARLGTREGSSK